MLTLYLKPAQYKFPHFLAGLAIFWRYSVLTLFFELVRLVCRLLQTDKCVRAGKYKIIKRLECKLITEKVYKTRFFEKKNIRKLFIRNTHSVKNMKLFCKSYTIKFDIRYCLQCWFLLHLP